MLNRGSTGSLEGGGGWCGGCRRPIILLRCIVSFPSLFLFRLRRRKQLVARVIQSTGSIRHGSLPAEAPDLHPESFCFVIQGVSVFLLVPLLPLHASLVAHQRPLQDLVVFPYPRHTRCPTLTAHCAVAKTQWPQWSLRTRRLLTQSSLRLKKHLNKNPGDRRLYPSLPAVLDCSPTVTSTM